MTEYIGLNKTVHSVVEEGAPMCAARLQTTCQFPLKDPFFGIDAIYDAFRAARTKTFLDHKKGHYERYSNTFSSKLSTLSVISTIEPESIKTVLSTSYRDYIVGAPGEMLSTSPRQ